jgi:hypothetical protein
MSNEEPKDQPIGTESGGSERRRFRFRRESPNYPDSPIVIPTERVDAARVLLQDVHGLWEEQHHYDSLLRWFGEPAERRDDAINTVLLEEIGDTDKSLSHIQHATRGRPSNLVLTHYPLFSTDAVRKIMLPSEDEPITERDVNALSHNPGSDGEFRRKFRTLGLKDSPFHDMDDFTEPRNDIVVIFNLEEARAFLLRLIPHISGDVERQLLHNYGVVSGIRHAELLTDPRLADRLERPLIRQLPWASYLENYMVQDAYPSPEFFEEAFRRLNPEDSDPHANFHIETGDGKKVTIPASLYYFNILRKIRVFEKIREDHPEYGQGFEDKIAAYLLNNAYMEHVLPYLETDEAYGDDFISGHRAIFHHTEVEATGEEAKQLKRQRLAEVINIAMDHARRREGESTLQSLTEREIGGIKFASLIKE